MFPSMYFISDRKSLSTFWGTDRFPVGTHRKKAEENYVKQRVREGWRRKYLRILSQMATDKCNQFAGTRIPADPQAIRCVFDGSKRLSLTSHSRVLHNKAPGRT